MNTIDVRFPDDGSIIDVEGLVIPNDSTTVVYGPNGAGKTTLLRRLAGIGGTVPMIEATYQPQQPYMFRGLAGMNLGLGLSPEESGLAGQYIQELEIKGLMTEPSESLSGGERQRLSLARTLAKRSDWVLLDEPLSAIDAADRSRVLALLASALDGRSAVLVTHDLDVAVALADRLVVMDDGKIVQQGPVAEVLAAPATTDVARIIGIGNVISGEGHAGHGLTRIEADGLTVVGRGSIDGPARAMFSAESVVLSRADSAPTSARNHWVGPVTAIRERASFLEVVVDAGIPIVALVTRGGADELGVEVGANLEASVKATSVVVLPT